MLAIGLAATGLGVVFAWGLVPRDVGFIDSAGAETRSVQYVWRWSDDANSNIIGCGPGGTSWARPATLDDVPRNALVFAAVGLLITLLVARLVRPGAR